MPTIAMMDTKYVKNLSECYFYNKWVNILLAAKASFYIQEFALPLSTKKAADKPPTMQPLALLLATLLVAATIAQSLPDFYEYVKSDVLTNKFLARVLPFLHAHLKC